VGRIYAAVRPVDPDPAGQTEPAFEHLLPKRIVASGYDAIAEPYRDWAEADFRLLERMCRPSADDHARTLAGLRPARRA